jgi:TetR/AcrR family transcriptional regulator
VAPSKSTSTQPDSTRKAASNHTRLSSIERREQLIHVAIDLFSRKGFNGTTTREIAAAAGVTEAIIFRHFETKENLYTAIIDQKLNSPITAGWVAKLHSAMDRDDDQAVIRELISAVIQTHKTDPKFERLMLYAALEGNKIALLYMREITSSIVDVFRNYFLRRQKQGRLKPYSPEVALTAIAGMAQHYAISKYVHELKEQCLSDEQAIENFASIAMEGMCLPAQRKTSVSARKR